MAGKENEFSSYRDIERLYEQQDVPVLSEVTLLAIKNYFEEHGCENVGGGLVFGDKPSTQEARSVAARNSSAGNHDTFYGPYLLGDAYYANGLGIWTIGEEI
jgi:hypothetical protein